MNTPQQIAELESLPDAEKNDLAALESVLNNAAELVQAVHTANNALKKPSPYTAGLKAKIMGAVEMLKLHMTHVAANPDLAAPAKPPVAALIALLLLLSSFFTAHAYVPFGTAPTYIQGSTNFVFTSTITTQTLLPLEATFGSVTNPATVINGYIYQSDTNGNLVVVGNWVYSGYAASTNGFTTNFGGGMTITLTNTLYFGISTGTNTVPFDGGTYGYP